MSSTANAEYWLPERNILSAASNLGEIRARDFATPVSLFLILKSIGIQKLVEIEYNSEKAARAIRFLGFMYDPLEKAPEEYEFVWPFGRFTLLKDSALKYARSRLPNTLRNGEKYRRFLVYKEGLGRNAPVYLMLKSDYQEVFSNLVFESLNQPKIDFKSIFLWTFRWFPFPYSEINQRYARNLFSEQFNLSDSDFSMLFSISQFNIQLTNNMLQGEKIREWIVTNMERDNIVVTRSQRSSEGELQIWNKEVRMIMSNTESSNKTIDEIYKILKNWKQVIFHGPPGTSKSYVAKKLSEKYELTKHIQFHPNYSYQEFIGGLFPDEETANKFKWKEGVLLRFTKDAIESEKEALLVIDEINRAKASVAFGEAVTVLDRDFDVELPGDLGSLKLPDNLHIVGTLNTADRTIAILDYAFRRRWRWIEFHVDYKLLARITDDSALGFDVTEFLKAINSRITKELGKDFVIGHTFLMPNEILTQDKYKWTKESFTETIFTSIIPQIQTYTLGNEQRAYDILGELANRTGTEEWEEIKRNIEFLVQNV